MTHNLSDTEPSQRLLTGDGIGTSLKLLLSNTRIHLVMLGLLATVLRIGYLLLGLQEKTLAEIARLSPDSSLFFSVAEYLRTGTGHGEYLLFQVGPGYALVLTGLNYLFGDTLLAPCLFSVIMGMAAPLIIYLLARQLTDSKTVSFIAAFFVAVSATSLSMSVSILSDQTFYTIQALSLLLFATGLKNGNWKWFIWSGIVVAAAVYIRSINQFWPFIFLFVAWVAPLPENLNKRFDLLKRASCTAGIMIIAIIALASFNYAKYDVFAFGGNGIGAARGYWAARTIAWHTEGIATREVGAKWRDEDIAYFSPHQPTVAEEYNRKRQHVLELFKEHPDWMIETFLITAWDNIKAESHFCLIQLPAYKSFWIFTYGVGISWLNRTIFYLSLFGILLLLYDRHRRAAVLLGSTLVYFTLITGFSFWQGSRLYFPAEMAWSILLAYVLVRSSTVVFALVRYPFIQKSDRPY